MKSESKARISNMVELAKSEEGIPILRKSLDQDKYLLNINNGTLNLLDFTISDHRQDDNITMLAPVEYDETATCPMFINFLNKIFKNDKEMIDFIQRAMVMLLLVKQVKIKFSSYMVVVAIMEKLPFLILFVLY